MGLLAELAFFLSASKLACAPSDLVASSAASATVVGVRHNKAKAVLKSRIASLHCCSELILGYSPTFSQHRHSCNLLGVIRCLPDKRQCGVLRGRRLISL